MIIGPRFYVDTHLTHHYKNYSEVILVGSNTKVFLSRGVIMHRVCYELLLGVF